MLGRAVLPLAVLALAIAMLASPSRADWALNGNPLSYAAGTQLAPALVPDGAGGVIAAWLDSRVAHPDIFAQHVTGTGTRVQGWAPQGDSVTNVPCARYTFSMAPDGSGGALLAWSENRCQFWRDIYAQRISGSGAAAPGWPVNGAPICLAADEQAVPVLADDGAGGAIIAWQDRRSGYWAVYAQHVSGAGAIAPGWPVDGLRVCDAVADQTVPAIVSDGAGGAIVAWQDHRSGNDIYLQHLTGAGDLAPGWATGGFGACTASGDQRSPVLIADGAGGAFVAWTDRRITTDDVYAARLTGSGGLATGWSANGTAVCTAPSDQQGPALAADGAGGLILTWQDARGGAFDIYAQRLDAAGAVAPGWIADGVPLCAAAGDQLGPQLAPDGSGGAFVVWQDARSGDPHIYAQHVGPAGAPSSGWPADGLPICTSSGAQQGPQIVACETGSAIVAWTDTRACGTSGSDVYATRVSAAGPSPTQVRDLAALHHHGQTFLTWTSPSGDGWTYHVYASCDPITQPSDLARVTCLGAVPDSTWYDRRLSVLTGTAYRYSIDSLAAPLTVQQGLFVVTPAASAGVYYAVTAQVGSCSEDRSLTPGVNVLTVPVQETAAIPDPVYQRTMILSGVLPTEIYTLWATDRGTAGFEAMANRPGMAFDCCVVRGGLPPQNSLLVSMHAREGNFLQGAYSGAGYPGRWALGLDDPLGTEDVNSFWYGYDQNYDPTLWQNPVQSTGTVHDYTLRRVVHTVLWARRHFEIDTTRVYTVGASMGGIGGMFLALRRPDLVAALMTYVAKFDFSFLGDPDPRSGFNPGNGLRDVCDRLWGPVATNLPSGEGLPAYEELNDGFVAGARAREGMPPLIAFNGKNDLTVGWAEKIPFYQAMRSARQGGAYYWDMRDHLGTLPGAWLPMQDTQYLYRFRTNLSYPALSNCSADGNPGDGTAATGDSVGTINGFLEWDTTLVDQHGIWETTLRLRDLTTLWGPVPAPDSASVDVTPRRLQAFLVVPDASYDFRVTRLSDDILLKSGSVVADSMGLVTVPGVRVYRSGTRVHLETPARLLDVPAAAARPSRPVILLLRNPVRGPTTVTVAWPGTGPARVDLFDAAGRLARALFGGPAPAGSTALRLETAGMPAGLYFLRARQGHEESVRRVVLVR